jgi:hypothetical protein
MTLTPGKIWPGSPFRLTNTYTDDTGDYVDPTTVTLKTIDPNGTEATYVYGTDTEVGRSGTGRYFADITLSRGGRWFYRWITTGDGTAIANEGDILVQRSPFVDDLGPEAYRQ